MRLTTILASIALAGLVSGGAMAATATAPATAPATTAPMKKAATPQTAVSKQCSTLADAKGLHGKDREKFRAACKKNGGKAPT